MSKSNLINESLFSGYVIKEKLGEGAYGTVYKAVKNDLSAEFVRAVKHIVIPSEKQYQSVYASMNGDVSKVNAFFKDVLNDVVEEIKILNALSEKDTQNIVRYYEHNIVSTGTPVKHDVYILMEYLTPLSTYISKTEFTVDDVIQLGLKILKALEICHDSDIIHRDIKNENILVSSSGEFKISDFGVSKLLKGGEGADTLRGAHDYIAPEVYHGNEDYTKSIDLYSLGIVLYKLLNYNRNPFMPYYPSTYTQQHVDDAFAERMKGGTPSFPSLGGKSVGEVIIKALSGESQRYKTAKEFYDALEKAKAETVQNILLNKISIAVSADINPGSETIGDDFLFGSEYEMPIGDSEVGDPFEGFVDETPSPSPFDKKDDTTTDGDQNTDDKIKTIFGRWWRDDLTENHRFWVRFILNIAGIIVIIFIILGVRQGIYNSMEDFNRSAINHVAVSNFQPDPNGLCGTETITIDINVIEGGLKWGKQKIRYTLQRNNGSESGDIKSEGYVEVFLSNRVWSEKTIELFTYDFMFPNNYILRLYINDVPLAIDFNGIIREQVVLYGHGR